LNTRGYDDVSLSGEKIVFPMAEPELQHHLSEHAEVYGDHFPFTPRKPEPKDAQRLISGIVNSSKASYAETLTSEINQIYALSLTAIPPQKDLVTTLLKE
jgi:hypothetical protein